MMTKMLHFDRNLSRKLLQDLYMVNLWVTHFFQEESETCEVLYPRVFTTIQSAVAASTQQQTTITKQQQRLYLVERQVMKVIRTVLL